MATNRLVVKEEVAVFASVLFDSANGAGGQEAVLQVREQMAEVIRLMRSDLDLTMALSNPDFTPEARRALVENVFAECHLAFREVLAVMAERGQADLLPRVNDEFRALLGERLGICVVDVTTAVPLDDGLRQLITEKSRCRSGEEGGAARAHRQVYLGRHHHGRGRELHRCEHDLAAEPRPQRPQRHNRWR